MSQRDPERPDARGSDESRERDEIEIIEVVGLEEVGDPREEAHVQRHADAAAAAEGRARRTAAPAVVEHYAGEQLMRLQADFDNYRKRVERERERQRKLAAEDLVRRMLPILDDFERALADGTPADAPPAFREGVVLIFRQVLDTLRKEGLTVIDSLGEPFDPAIHEAVATAAYPGLPENTVVEELRRGYLLHDRLLRPAMVRVSIDPSGGAHGRERG